MRTKWNKQTFSSLKELWQNSEHRPGLAEHVLARRGRYEDILRLIESDRIWPPVVSPGRRKFKAALCEVASRLPEEAFNQVESEIGFVVEDPSVEMLAVNVPAPPLPNGRGKRGIDTIVFFRECLNFAPDALIGVIAHEIAHSFVRGSDYLEDEALVDAKARKWGFGSELDCLARAKEALRNGS